MVRLAMQAHLEEANRHMAMAHGLADSLENARKKINLRQGIIDENKKDLLNYRVHYLNTLAQAQEKGMPTVKAPPRVTSQAHLFMLHLFQHLAFSFPTLFQITFSWGAYAFSKHS